VLAHVYILCCLLHCN